jgi:hypothetical protein
MPEKRQLVMSLRERGKLSVLNEHRQPNHSNQAILLMLCTILRPAGYPLFTGPRGVGSVSKSGLNIEEKKGLI